jgi:PA domain/Secretion system C-terminal sorting domain
MKKFTFILGVVFALFVANNNLKAQGTDGDGFLFSIDAPLNISGTYKQELCGWGGSLFGPEVTSDVTADCAWAKTINGDSLGCTAIENDLTGKFAVIRRGFCNFSLKVYNAQQAGAKGVLILNHYNNAADVPCTIFGMSAGDSAAAVTIPSIFLCRNVSELITTSLDAGNVTTVSFLLPTMYEGTVAYSYATPVTQVDTLANMQIHYVNRSSLTEDNVVVKLNITEPTGDVRTFAQTIASVPPGLDTVISFPAYLPPSIEGKFKAVFSSNLHTSSRDSLTRTFVHSKYTWATDNYTIDPQGIGPTNIQFQTNGFKHQIGALCLTGDDPAGIKASFASFGIANKDSVYVAGGDAGSNEILVIVYDADVNNDAIIDDFASFEDMDDNFQQVGFGVYTMGANEVNDSIVNVPLGDLLGNDFVEMKPNHTYYVSLKYDGLLAGHGRCVRFSNTTDEFYLNFPTTPVYVDQLYSGWAGAVVIARLHAQGFEAGSIDPVAVNSPKLDASKLSLVPNPANEQVNLDFQLAETNKSVTVRMMDWSGNVVKTEIRRDFQNGRVSMNTNDLPSGAYVMWVSTLEGTAFRKVMICH